MQHFMKKKFPEFSLRNFQNSMRNTFPLMRLVGSQEVVLAQPTVIVTLTLYYNQSHRRMGTLWLGGGQRG